MSVRNLVAVAVMWALSLIGVGVWAQGAQGSGFAARRMVAEQGTAYGPVITGENIGFQRVGSQADKPGKVTGRLVVKIDGEWMEVIPTVGITR